METIARRQFDRFLADLRVAYRATFEVMRAQSEKRREENCGQSSDARYRRDARE